MAKYLDQTGLQHLITKINGNISDGDAKAIKKVHFDDASRTIKFFKDEGADTNTAGDFSVIIPDDVDTSGLIEKLVGATDGNVVIAKTDGTIEDGGVKLTDLATKAELTEVSDTKVGDIGTLNTTEKNSVVGAINELKTDTTSIDGKIGVLTNLNTTHKDTVVGAINEVNTGLGGKADKSTSLDGYGIENAYTKDETDAAIKVVSDKVGDLGVLTTTDTNSIVGAINELKTAVDTADTEIGDLGTLTTAAQDSLVNAINEIEAQVDALQRGTYDDTPLREMIGTVGDLTTTEKTNLVGAVNELDVEIATVKTESTVTIEDGGVDGASAKIYVIKQNNQEIGKINIPKDMVVQSGQIVENPVGQAPGKYVELTIANGTGDKIYINVADLVDAYTAAQGAAQVQLAISGVNEISATIVAGSITATELANDAVTTAKILNANVTLAKLATDVTAAFDSAGSATAAETNAKQYTDQKFAEITSIQNGEIDAMFTP